MLIVAFLSLAMRFAGDDGFCLKRSALATFESVKLTRDDSSSLLLSAILFRSYPVVLLSRVNASPDAGGCGCRSWSSSSSSTSEESKFSSLTSSTARVEGSSVCATGAGSTLACALCLFFVAALFSLASSARRRVASCAASRTGFCGFSPCPAAARAKSLRPRISYCQILSRLYRRRMAL